MFDYQQNTEKMINALKRLIRQEIDEYMKGQREGQEEG